MDGGASVIGREFNHQLLRLLFDVSGEDRLIELLEEALAAGVIEELPQGEGGYQFGHAFIQETLAGELTLTRRARLHARIGQALEDLYGSDAERHAAELAYHFTQAQTVLGPDKLVRYSIMAGNQALAAYAWEEGQRHFERGLAARGISLSGGDPLPDDEAAALIFGFGRARIGTAERLQMQEVVSSLSRAFDYYMETGDGANAFAVAIADHHVPIASIHAGMTRIIHQALTLVAPGSLEEGRLLARYGVELGRVERDYPAAQEAFDRALTIARDGGDPRLELSILTGSADVDFFQLQLQSCLAKSLEGINIAVRDSNIYAEVIARLNVTRALIFMGEAAAAEPQAESLLTLAERLRDRYLLGFAIQHNSNLACLRGNWSKGRKLAEDGLAVSSQDFNNLVILAMLEYETGNFDQGEAYLERLLDIMAQTPPGARMAYCCSAMAIPYASRASGVCQRLDAAAEAARIVLASPSPYPMFSGVARCGLGLQAIVQGDVTAAAEQYTALDIVKGILVHQHLAGDRMLGLLAHTMGELGRAAEHFEDSLAFCRRADYRPELAWTCCDYADTLLQRSDNGDRERAISLLDESLAISTELGMRPLMERSQSRLSQISAASSPTAGYPDGLTPREVEVLTLIAQGKSNRGIGEELVISEGTVRRHVNNIYDKIGVANRTEAAGYAIRQGLS